MEKEQKTYIPQPTKLKSWWVIKHHAIKKNGECRYSFTHSSPRFQKEWSTSHLGHLARLQGPLTPTGYIWGGSGPDLSSTEN
jgi:hypothetical protein